MQYIIKKAITSPELQGLWSGPAWKDANIATINHFLPESSNHHPRTEAKVLYDRDGLYVLFRAMDQYVICTRDVNQQITSKDSCVEVYFQPFPQRSDIGYLNFEMNCGGTILLYYITDPIRCEETIFKERTIVPQHLIDTMKIYHSLPKTVPVEIKDPIEWTVEYFIPFSLFEHYVPQLNIQSGAKWRGNFFKCADESSHPHWASWSPVHEFNFHVIKYFGDLIFE